MAHPLGADVHVLETAVRAFGVEAGAIKPIEAGRANRHWRVESGEGGLILRQYSSFRTLEAIEQEHVVLAFAALKGWPVARPLSAPGDATIVEAGGERFALFPFLHGEPAPLESRTHRRIKGRLLARLHSDLGSGPLEQQRDGFGRAWELDVVVQQAGAASFNDTLARFGRDYPEAAASVRRQRYRSLRELARLGYGDMPARLVHCDFHHDNILFQGADLTGVLGFDSCRLDAPAYDIACSLFLDCMASPTYDALDLDRARAFLEGYVGHRPLGEDEVRLLPALFRAAQLWLVAFRLAEWHRDRNARSVGSIIRSAERRFPALDAVIPDLETLAATATP